MVGLLFAFMPVLAHKPGGSKDSGAMVARLLFRQAPSTCCMTVPVVLQAGATGPPCPVSVFYGYFGRSVVSTLLGAWLSYMQP